MVVIVVIVVIIVIIVIVVISSNSSYNCTPFLHPLLTKGKERKALPLKPETSHSGPKPKP